VGLTGVGCGITGSAGAAGGVMSKPGRMVVLGIAEFGRALML